MAKVMTKIKSLHPFINSPFRHTAYISHSYILFICQSTPLPTKGTISSIFCQKLCRHYKINAFNARKLLRKFFNSLVVNGEFLSKFGNMLVK